MLPQSPLKISEVEGKGYIFKMKVTGYKDGTQLFVIWDGQCDYVGLNGITRMQLR